MYRHKLLVEVELDHVASALQDHPSVERLESHIKRFTDPTGFSAVAVVAADAVWVSSEEIG